MRLGCNPCSVSAGEAEVHPAPVPCHVGRLGGSPGPGHGDLLCYSTSAPRQRPELHQEDPGLGGGGELVLWALLHFPQEMDLRQDLTALCLTAHFPY